MTRTYEASFLARNRDVPYGDVGLRVEGKRWELDFSGRLAADPGSVGEITNHARNRASVAFRYGF